MYLVDTDVASELRKGPRADPGVRRFVDEAAQRDQAIYLSAITAGELRRGVELVRRRGDGKQAELLERWLQRLLDEYDESILPFDHDAAAVWGALRVPDPGNALDKQVAAIALLYGLVVVTRNVRHFAGTGATVLNPFSA